jgi:hypothetical protein
VRALSTIFERTVLAIRYRGENFALGGLISLQLVDEDHARDVGHLPEEGGEALLRRLLVPAALDQESEHVIVLLDRPPQRIPLPLDGERQFIEMPYVPGARTLTPQFIGILLTKLATPLAGGFIGHSEAAFREQCLNIAEARAEPQVEPDGIRNDLRRKTVATIVWVASLHGPSLLTAASI